MKAVIAKLGGTLAVLGAVALGLWWLSMFFMHRANERRANALALQAAADGEVVLSLIHQQSARSALQSANEVAEAFTARANALIKQGRPGAAAVLERLNRHAKP